MEEEKIEQADATLNDEEVLPSEEKNDEVVFDFDGLRNELNSHLENIKALLKMYRDKDNNVTILVNEIQHYRTGIDFYLIRPLALKLITFREDAKRSIREAPSDLTKEKALKYLGFTLDDYVDLLDSLGIDDSDPKNVLYKNKSLNEITHINPQFSPLGEVKEMENISIDSISSLEEVHDYLVKCENCIKEILSDNSVRDKLLNEYIKASMNFEAQLPELIVYPLIKDIAILHGELDKLLNSVNEEITDENALEKYVFSLNLIIKKLENILTNAGVVIDPFVDEMLDRKKHQVLKVIPSEKPEDNAKVANRYTDCYSIGDRVIYLSKIDVFKA